MEEIRSRRRLDKILRHERAVAYHRAKLQEQALLMQLDKEREDAIFKEIERQRSLEFEKERTRELKYQMELESEKKTQKELEGKGTDSHSTNRKVIYRV